MMNKSEIKTFQSFKTYLDTEPIVLQLTDEEAGRIFKACYGCYFRGETLEFRSSDDRLFRGAWGTFEAKLLSEREKDSKTSESRALAGSAGGKAKASNTKQTKAKANNTKQTKASDSTYTDIITETNSYTDTISFTVTETDEEQADADFVSAGRPGGAAAAKAAPQSDDLFSVSRLLDIVATHKVRLTKEGVWAFFEEMQESGWILYGKEVEKKGIVKALRGWAKYHPEYNFKWSEDMEDNISRLLEYYTSNALTYELRDINTLIAEYCPREIFSKEQLEFMEDEWQVRPRPRKSVKIDPILETERESF